MRPIVADVAGKVSHVKVVRPTGVDKGAQGAQGAQAPPPQSPGKKKFQLKQWDFQASLQLNPVVHVTITQREGAFLSDAMYTGIAYLIEIRKFCSKNLVHKGVNFEAQNALKLTYEHL